MTDAKIQATRVKTPKRKIYIWKSANFAEMEKDTTNKIELFMRKSFRNVDDMWVNFKSILLNTMEEHVPSKLSRFKPTYPWITTEVRRLISRKNKAGFKARKTNTQKDRERFRKLKSQTQRATRAAYNSYIYNIISPEQSNNPKRFWSFIKSKKQENSGVAPLRADNGIIYSDSKNKAEILNSQFKSAYTQEDTNSLPELKDSSVPAMPRIIVNQNGVKKLLLNLNEHKASGPDEIPPRLLKHLSNIISPALTRIYQLSLDTRTVPTDWKTANIVPVFKKGDKSTASNYRPVSLTSICCKLQEHIICSNIMDHLTRHHILSDCQHGFRARRSCETQLITTIQDLAKNLSDGNQIDAILLDFSKAFDKVPHKRLSMKLQYYGIQDNTLAWIQHFLEDRTQQVLLEGNHSSTCTVDSGVPQGTVLGPLLFLLFINDLPEVVTSNARLFADDCLLYRVVNSKHDQLKLQSDLQKLEEWEKTWQMQFNASKCFTLHITRKRKTMEFDYQLHQQTLEVTKDSKYLGVTISNDLSWTTHINNISAKANRSIGFLRRNIHACPKTVKANAYTTLVRPVVEYASAVWDPYTKNQISQLESVQRRAARFVYNNFQNRDPGAVTAMLSDLGWETLEQRRAKIRAVMMYKIVYNLVDIPAENLLIPADSRTRSSSNTGYKVIYTRSDLYKYSFFPRTILTWNLLPLGLRQSTSVEQFRASLGSSTLAVLSTM